LRRRPHHDADGDDHAHGEVEREKFERCHDHDGLPPRADEGRVHLDDRLLRDDRAREPVECHGTAPDGPRSSGVCRAVPASSVDVDRRRDDEARDD
jgi:hypothetical protein